MLREQPNEKSSTQYAHWDKISEKLRAFSQKAKKNMLEHFFFLLQPPFLRTVYQNIYSVEVTLYQLDSRGQI